MQVVDEGNPKVLRCPVGKQTNPAIGAAAGPDAIELIDFSNNFATVEVPPFSCITNKGCLNPFDCNQSSNSTMYFDIPGNT